ncbi:MAG: cyclic nucleotide-binding domain-containing protein, partial [Bacteriovoracales bacterium]
MAFSNIKLKEGDVLFVEGELITEFFIIKKGEVKIIKEKQGRLSIIRNLVTGDFIGEVAMFTGEKLRGATVI